MLLDLKEQGIVGLPIHDAVLVPASSSELVREVMEKVFEDHTGVEGVVSEEGGRGYSPYNIGTPPTLPLRDS